MPLRSKVIKPFLKSLDPGFVVVTVVRLEGQDAVVVLAKCVLSFPAKLDEVHFNDVALVSSFVDSLGSGIYQVSAQLEEGLLVILEDVEAGFDLCKWI